MSKLGDFLEVVYGPADGFTTLRASIRQWRNRSLAETAGANRHVMGKRKAQSDSATQIDETGISVWIERSDRMRIEVDSQKSENRRSQLTVINGDQTWTRDDQGHVEETKKTPQERERAYRAAGATLVDRYFSHASLREFFTELTLESMGEVRVADHDCVRVRARLRPGCSLWPHWLPCGADEYEFHVEPNRGLVLSIHARCAGAVFESGEVTDVVFDEPIDDKVFSYTPAYGEQVRPAAPIVEHINLEAAVKRMPFTVLIPNQVPNAEHAHCEVMYHPPRVPSSRPFLSLMYRWGLSEQSLWLHEAETIDPELEKYEWEDVARNGRELRLSDPDIEGGRRAIALMHDGTYVTIWSDIAREPLLDLAASLAPPMG